MQTHCLDATRQHCKALADRSWFRWSDRRPGGRAVADVAAPQAAEAGRRARAPAVPRDL